MPSSPTPEPRASSVVMRGQGDERHGLLSASSAVAREREALLSLVVDKASIIPGGTNYPYNTSDEHQTWAFFGEWRAGAQTPMGARGALKDVIRAALIEQTGGTDAAS